MSTTSEVTFETAMPFVLCHSNGGPYDDEAFMSGWRLGDLAATLSGPGFGALADSIRPAERHQAELIAMACGYTMTVDDGDDPDWLLVSFRRDD